MVGGAEIQPALASGAINIGWTNVISMGQGHAQGFDFRFVANGAINKRGTNDVFGFLVRQDSPIKSAKELEGKTVATNNVRNIIHAAGLHWIDANGGDSGKVKWVEIPFPQMTPALVNKQIDAFVAVEPFVTVPTTVQKQARVLGHMLGGIAPRLLIASYFGSEAWIGKNVQTVKSFVTAINRGIDAHNANLEEARAMIAKYTGLKPEFLKEMPAGLREEAPRVRPRAHAGGWRSLQVRRPESSRGRVDLPSRARVRRHSVLVRPLCQAIRRASTTRKARLTA